MKRRCETVARGSPAAPGSRAVAGRARLAGRAEGPHLDRLCLGVDDPELLHALPLAELPLHAAVATRGGGREDFDHQVGSAPDARLDDPVPARRGNEHDVGLYALAGVRELDADRGDPEAAKARFDENLPQPNREAEHDVLMPGRRSRCRV